MTALPGDNVSELPAGIREVYLQAGETDFMTITNIVYGKREKIRNVFLFIS